MREIKITTPLTASGVRELKAGDRVFITGVVYTARDAAHGKMIEALNNGEALPFLLKGAVIYYVGPCPPKQGEVIGSAGPTTSYRMDDYTPKLLEKGLKGMIGKGNRNKDVIAAIMKNKAVYFGAIGGAGALIANSIKSSRVIAYKELGTEAIRELWVEDLPAIVVIDCYGNNLYTIEGQKYKK